MAFTYITVTHTFETAADVAAAGQVDFTPITPMHNGVTVVKKSVTATLSAVGALSQQLAANTDPDTVPTGTTYQVTERLTGQTPLTYYVQIPHDQGSPINLRDLAGWVGGTGTGGGTVSSINGEGPDGFGDVVLSATDVGAQPADGDLTGLAGLGDGVPRRASGTWGLVSGTPDGTKFLRDDGTWASASGTTYTDENARDAIGATLVAGSNVTITPNDGADTITISAASTGSSGIPASTVDAKGDLIVGTANDTVARRSVGTDGQALLADSVATTGVSWGAPVPADSSVTNAKVATGAAISADKLADGTTNKIMTAAERTKLTALANAFIDPTAYGAVGNGVADDTAALNSAIAALTPGATLLIASGKVYTHTSSLTITTNSIRITGGGEIRATVPTSSAVRIQGNYVHIDNIKLTCPTATTRGSTLNHHKLVLEGCVGASIHKVVIDKSNAAGMFIYGASYYHIDACHVSNTLADSYHNVKASHHGIITNCEALNSGDDMFAVVSYSGGGDAGLTHHIRISDCKGTTNVGGRGFTVVGGEDVEISSCMAVDTRGAGILIATETAIATMSVARVVVRDMELNGANSATVGRPNHGAVLVSAIASGTTISDVSIRNVRLVDTDNVVATKQVAIEASGGGAVSNITFEGISVFGTGPSAFFTSSGVTSSNYTVTDCHPTLAGWGWELLATASTSTASTGAITIPIREELMIVVRSAGFSSTDIPALRFNADTGNNYWSRYITAAAGGTTLTNTETTSTDQARLSGLSSIRPRVITATVNNISSWEKTGSVVTATATAGAATASTADVTGAIQWGTTGSQITSVELRSAGGSATFGTGTRLFIFGRSTGS